MELAVSYLAGLGHRKIAYLSSSLGARVLQARHAAFLRSMHQHGLKTSPAAIGCSYYLSECMEKHLPRFLENGITAIICNQDTLASATLTQCQQLGFQIPDDISIIGFDDLPIAACTSPPLTTIRQDRLELGKSGFFALSSLLNHIPISTYLLHAQLIQRESTGKVPSSIHLINNICRFCSHFYPCRYKTAFDSVSYSSDIRPGGTVKRYFAPV